MDEARIKALFQQHARLSDAPLDETSAEDILAVLDRHGWPADETGPLDRVAASSTAAAIARVVAELGADSETLARELHHTRAKRPSRLQRFARRGLVLAAGSGALALLFTMNPTSLEVHDEVQMSMDAADVISVISFEEHAPTHTGSQAKRPAESIFSGSFDS